MESNGIDLSFTFAPVYWGFVASLVLCGITVIQAYIYFPCPNDRLSIRFAAGLVFALDLVSSGLVAQTVYYYLIPHFGSLAQLDTVPPELSVECLISTIIMLISQLFFVLQLYHVKRSGDRGSWIMIGLIVLCAIVAFAGGIGCVAAMYTYRHSLLANRRHIFSIFFGIAKGFGAITDILATTAMCLFLSSSKTSISQTNSLLKSLMEFVMHRGALVTLVQTLFLITFFVSPHSLSWVALHVNVTKLYANTFFAMLNARDRLKTKHQTPAITVSRQAINREHRLSNDVNFGSVESQEFKDDKTLLPPMPIITKSVFVAEV